MKEISMRVRVFTLCLLIIILMTTIGCGKESSDIISNMKAEELGGASIPQLFREGIGYYDLENLDQNHIKIELFNGLVYLGELPKDNEVYLGKLLSKDNELVYEGEFKDFLANGQGKLHMEEDLYYEGEFINGVATGNGKGKMRTIMGSIYEGNISDGKPTMLGKIEIEDDSQYYGLWYKGDYLTGLYNIFDNKNKVKVIGDFGEPDYGYFNHHIGYMEVVKPNKYGHIVNRWEYMELLEDIFLELGLTERDIETYVEKTYDDLFKNEDYEIVGLPFIYGQIGDNLSGQNKEELINSLEDEKLKRFIDLLSYVGDSGMDAIVGGNQERFARSYYYGMIYPLSNETKYSDEEAFLKHTLAQKASVSIHFDGVHVKDISDLIHYFYGIENYEIKSDGGLEEIYDDRLMFDGTGYTRQSDLTEIEQIEKNKEYKLTFNIRINEYEPHELGPLYHSIYEIFVTKEDGNYKIKNGIQKHEYRLVDILHFDHLIDVDIKLDEIAVPTNETDAELVWDKIEEVYSLIKYEEGNRGISENIEEFIKRRNEIFIDINEELNEVDIDSFLIDDRYDNLKISKNRVEQIISKYDNLNIKEKVDNSLLINIGGNSNKNPVMINIFDDIQPYLDSIDILEIKLSDMIINLNSGVLNKYFSTNNILKLQIAKRDGELELSIIDSFGDTIKLDDNVRLGIVTDLDNPNVYYDNENLGGYLDNKRNMIYFDTKSSGLYEFKESKEGVQATDVEELSDEVKDAIQNLTEKDILDLRDEKFRPDEILTRYEFTKAIVKILYELDQELEVTFTDVSLDNPYYHYIASSEEKGIVKGYPDNTFKGERDISREEFISICSRSLNEKGGYLYPDNIEEILTFKDSKKVSDYAKKEVALAISNNLININELFEPQAQITRMESAVILNRLIEMLNSKM